MEHLSALVRLDKADCAKALKRPVADAEAETGSSKADFAAASAVRKLERQLATIRGVAVVFDE